MLRSNQVILKGDASCKHACRPRGLGRKERGHETKGRGKIVKDEGRRRLAWWHGTNLCGRRRQLPALLEEWSVQGRVGLLRSKSGCDQLHGPLRQRCDHGRGQVGHCTDGLFYKHMMSPWFRFYGFN